MKEFDKIIGYESIKNELVQLVDMIKNKPAYEKLGAKLPRGVLLHGDPGLGKTLMAKCFIKASGLKSYVIRRNKGTTDFVNEITNIFHEAKQNAPSIIFLDDMDKFANEDDDHRDAEEYVAVQSGIDTLEDAEVVIIATTNEIYKLPPSLCRSGRFDRKIEVKLPSEADHAAIIKYYLDSKPLSNDVNYDDITKMIGYNSCAELESIMNEAAINAAYAKRDSISIADVVQAVLRMEYNSPDTYSKESEAHIREAALHEAGHLVVCEVLIPGSVGLASIRKAGRDNTGGFMRRCMDVVRRQEILICLGGKAATELYNSETCASGCAQDLERAYKEIRIGITASGTCGLSGIRLNEWGSASDVTNARIDTIIHAELEKYMFKSRDILIKNKDFLEKVAEALIEKETLLHSDIQKIRSEVSIVEVAL